MSKTQNMIVVQKDNMSQKPMKIVLGKFQDSDCGMVINDIDYASQVISPSGKTWFFHDHGGMVNWISTKEFKDDAVIWVHSLDTNKWIDGRTAFYSRDEKTPMLYGFGAYENKTDKLISYDEMFLHMLRGEHLGNPSMQKNILKGSH
jgi:nitrous oxide reductase accessory protein NosL